MMMPRTLARLLVLSAGAAALGGAANLTRGAKALPWVIDRKLLAPSDEATLEEVRAASTAGTSKLVDARKREEYEAGHISGASNIPSVLLPVEPPFIFMRAGPQDDVILYCTGGKCDESQRVLEQLRAMGFQRVRMFKGGWEVYAKSGLPIEKGPDPLPLGK